MIRMTVAARQATIQMLAATSTGFEPEALLLLSAGEPILDWLMSAVRKNTQHPVKHSNSQAKPPNFVLVGEPAKISAKKEKAIVGKGRRNNEYLLINNFNLSDGDANALADFVHDFDHMVNLIPYNHVEGKPYERPTDKKIEKFVKTLEEIRKVNVFIRKEILGNCSFLSVCY